LERFKAHVTAYQRLTLGFLPLRNSVNFM